MVGWVDGWVNWVGPPKSFVQKIKIELKTGLKIKCIIHINDTKLQIKS